MKKIREIMRPDVVSIRPETTASEAFALMRKRGVRHLPVVDDDGQIAGILSDRDLRNIMVFLDKDSNDPDNYLIDNNSLVSSIMVSSPRTVEPDDDVRRALLLMYDGKFSSVPVALDGRLVGIVTLTDVLKLLYELLAKGA